MCFRYIVYCIKDAHEVGLFYNQQLTRGVIARLLYLNDNMKNIKKPKWLEDKKKANEPKETVIIVSLTGVDSVKDGRLPNGDVYLWKKRRK